MGDETVYTGVSTGMLSPVKSPQHRAPSPLLPRGREFFSDSNEDDGGVEDSSAVPDSSASAVGHRASTADLSVVSSPRVSVLATSLFQELSVLVEAHGEGSVAGVIPIVVNMLETLDESLHDLSETQSVLDEITEDNEQLHAQFEKERKLRRDEQQMRLGVEDAMEAERRETTEEKESLRHNNRRLKKQLTDSKDQLRRTEERLDKLKSDQSELRNKYTRVNHALQLALRRDTSTLSRRTSLTTESPLLEESEEIGPEGVSVTMSLPASSLKRRALPSMTGASQEPALPIMSAIAVRHPVSSAESVNEQPITEEITSMHAVASSVIEDHTHVHHPTVTSSPRRPGQQGHVVSLPVDESGNLLSSIRVGEEDQPAHPSIAEELAVGDVNEPSGAKPHQPVAAAMAVAAGKPVAAHTASSAAVGGTRMEAEEAPAFERAHVHFAPGSPAVTAAADDDQRAEPLTASVELAVRVRENKRRDEDDEHQYERHMQLQGANEEEDENAENMPAFSEELLEQFVTEDGSLLDVDPGADITVMDSENLVRQIHDLDKKKDELEKVIRQREEEIQELTTEREFLQQKVEEIEDQQGKKTQKITSLEEELRQKERKLEEVLQGRPDNDDLSFPLDENWRVNRETGRRFTRVEMGKVVKERNEYKEKYHAAKDELENLRKQLAKPGAPRKKQKLSLWQMFAELFKSNSSRKGGKIVKTEDNVSMEVLEMPEAQESAPAPITFGEARFEAYGWSLPDTMKPSITTPVTGGGLEHDGEAAGDESITVDTNPLETVPLLTHCSPVTGMEDQDRYYIPTSRVFSAAAVCCTPQSNPSLWPSDTVCPSSLIWLCVGNSDLSRVDVIDSNSPKEVVSSFPVGSSPILAIACVPGVELDGGGSVHIATSGLDSRTLSRAEIEKWRLSMSPAHSPARSRLHTLVTEQDKLSVHSGHFDSRSSSERDPRSPERMVSPEDQPDGPAAVAAAEAGASDFEVLSDDKDEPDRAPVRQSPSDFTPSEIRNRPKMLHPTMWLGAEFGALYVHSAIDSWSSCLHAMKVEASPLSIVYTHGKVFISMENGQMMVFHRDEENIWDFDNFDVIDICNYVDSTLECTIPATAILAVGDNVWCGVGNSIVVLSIETFKPVKTFLVHPSSRSIVQRLVRCDDGVWVSVRRDSTLRLFNAVTMEHVQDLDVSQQLQSLLSLPGSQRKPSRHNLVRITTLLVSNGCLWVGANNGAIISLPCSSARPKIPGEDAPKVVVKSNDDGSVAKEMVAEGDDPLTSSGNECDGGRRRPVAILEVTQDQLAPYKLPYCDLESARLSFHGHLHHVDVIVAAPGAMATRTNPDTSQTEVSSPLTYVVSAGPGYVDFRLDRTVTSAPSKVQSERNHVIVWQVNQPNDS